MPSYRVKIDGKTVWKGEGDDYKVIPAEYRNRPAQEVGDPYPSPHILFETDEDGVEQIIGVQVSEYHELALELGPEPGEKWENARTPDEARAAWAELTAGRKGK